MGFARKKKADRGTLTDNECVGGKTSRRFNQARIQNENRHLKVCFFSFLPSTETYTISTLRKRVYAVTSSVAFTAEWCTLNADV